MLTAFIIWFAIICGGFLIFGILYAAGIFNKIIANAEPIKNRNTAAAMNETTNTLGNKSDTTLDTDYDYAFMPSGSNYGANAVTGAHSYTVVSDTDPNAGQPGFITESDYDRLLYIVAHEVGDCNPNEKFGVASALLNSLEQQWDSDSLTGNIDGFFDRNAGGGPNDKNSIYYDAENRAQLKDDVKEYVDLALSGTRAFTEEIQCWNTLEGTNNTRCKFGTPIDVKGTYITSGKSGY